MRFIMFRSWLVKMMQVVEPQLLVYEQCHHRGGAATQVLVGLETLVLELCARYKVEHAGVHTATLKKWATGSGRASKEDMKGAAERLLLDATKPSGGLDVGVLELPIESDDEADALCLLFYSLKEWPEDE